MIPATNRYTIKRSKCIETRKELSFPDPSVSISMHGPLTNMLFPMLSKLDQHILYPVYDPFLLFPFIYLLNPYLKLYHQGL